jgi:hypothetical protein
MTKRRKKSKRRMKEAGSHRTNFSFLEVIRRVKASAPQTPKPRQSWKISKHAPSMISGSPWPDSSNSTKIPFRNVYDRYY